MPIRPARCYTKITGPAYTRRKFMKGVPGSKIVKFNYGDMKRDFPLTVAAVSLDDAQIRHLSLEACRVAVNNYCTKTMLDAFHIAINVKPHHVLRENKMMAFAGADRLQAGMRKSFGKPAAAAARVHQGQILFTLSTEEKNFLAAKDAIRRGMRKLPAKCRFVILKAPDELKHRYGFV